jgi:hypothetical protein
MNAAQVITRSVIETVSPRVVPDLHERRPKYLTYCLRAFLETAERQFCPRWPVSTPGIPQRFADAAVEYRAERARMETVA